MKKTLWKPLVLGTALGLMDFVSVAVNFIIPLGPFGATGPQEVFIIITSVLGGPLGLTVASLIHESGGFLFFLKTQFSPQEWLSTGVLFAAADFCAHVIAALAAAYCYRFLYRRSRKAIAFFAGWMLIVMIYYTLLVFFQSFLISKVIHDVPPLSMQYMNNLVEFLVVLIITTLIWIALPARYRKPLWYEIHPSPSTSEANTVIKEAVT